MMLNTNINIEDITSFINSLPIDDFKNIIDNYSKTNKVDFQFRNKNLNLEDKLTELNINSCCPKCNSDIISKTGKNSHGYQRFQCRECNTIFTRFTGTILEKTNYSIKSSNYREILKKNNYFNLSEEETEKLLLKLYNNDLIDKLDNN